MISAKSLMEECISTAMSFILIRNRRGPRIEPCGIPVLIADQAETAPGSTTLCILLRGSCKKFCHWVRITSVLRFIKHIFITNLQSIPPLLKHIFVTFYQVAKSR